jgi:hypothetical protein
MGEQVEGKDAANTPYSSTGKHVQLFGFIFWLHLVIILLAYASPFLFHWKWIVVGIVLLWIQTRVFGGCVLTHAQFGKSEKLSIYSVYLELMGIHFKRAHVIFVVTYILPCLVLIIALVWQVLLRKVPLLF